MAAGKLIATAGGGAVAEQQNNNGGEDVPAPVSSMMVSDYEKMLEFINRLESGIGTMQNIELKIILVNLLEESKAFRDQLIKDNMKTEEEEKKKKKNKRTIQPDDEEDNDEEWKKKP